MAAIEELISEDTLHTFLKAQEEDSAFSKVIEALKNGTAFPSSTCSARVEKEMGYFAASLGHHVQRQCVHSWWSLKVM